ncbi:MAG TPA: tetratricopeptide repeat protein [Gemmatimonadaceae bacterium]|jgi:TolB-like protein|nr:tetratricopeptide repeat protein [Gemmatimonadaceae bacterium]
MMTAAPVAAKPHGVLKMMVVVVCASGLIALAILASNKVQDAAFRMRDQSPAIAVLPFENVGKDEGQEFADGMTEEITNRLASLHGLRVIGRQSAKGYAGTGKSPQEIAKELNVKYILTGTVRWDKSPDGKDLVRVSPALLRTSDATQMWTEAYQTALTGMFDLQSKVATQVATALNLTLPAPERRALGAKPTDSRTAYSSYLHARQILDSTYQSPQLREAIGLLQKAVAADPEFVIAWASLGAAHTQLYWYGGDPTKERLRLARAALDKAVSLDPELPEVQLARGVYLFHGERNYEAASRAFEMTRALRPSDPNVASYQGAIQMRQGRVNEAIESFRRTVDLDPRSAASVEQLARTLLYARRYHEAESLVDQAMALAPTGADAARDKTFIAINSRGNVPEAIEHLRNAVRTVQPQSSLTSLLFEYAWPAVEDPSLRKILTNVRYTRDMRRGWYYAHKADLMMYLGDLPHARSYADSATTVLAEEISKVPETSAVHTALAQSYSITGNKKEAFDELTRADEALAVSPDAFRAAERENARVFVLTNLGDYDSAITAMEKRLDVPGGLSRNYLRLNPRFAVMRANPRFQRLIQDR